jgi:hypothetical protein
LVLPHGPSCLGAHLRRRELAAAFYHRQALRHGCPGLGGTAEFRQVGIAALHIAEVDTSTGAQQLQREVLRGVLKGHDDHRDVHRCCRSDLQRQRRFAHAGRASEQVQSLGEATQQAIELRHPRGDPQHGVARRLPLLTTRFRVRQDPGQQRTRPL